MNRYRGVISLSMILVFFSSPMLAATKGIDLTKEEYDTKKQDELFDKSEKDIKKTLDDTTQTCKQFAKDEIADAKKTATKQLKDAKKHFEEVVAKINDRIDTLRNMCRTLYTDYNSQITTTTKNLDITTKNFSQKTSELEKETDIEKKFEASKSILDIFEKNNKAMQKLMENSLAPIKKFIETILPDDTTKISKLNKLQQNLKKALADLDKTDNNPYILLRNLFEEIKQAKKAEELKKIEVAKKLEETNKLLEEANKLTKDAKTLEDEATELVKNKKFDDAIDTLEEANKKLGQANKTFEETAKKFTELKKFDEVEKIKDAVKKLEKASKNIAESVKNAEEAKKQTTSGKTTGKTPTKKPVKR